MNWLLVLEKNKEIPNGWIQTPFETISEVKNGFAFKSSSYTESGVPLIRISNIQDQTISLENNCVFLSIDNLEKYPEFKSIPVSDVWAKTLKVPCPFTTDTAQFKPSTHGTDGFFVSIFERKNKET